MPAYLWINHSIYYKSIPPWRFFNAGWLACTPVSSRLGLALALVFALVLPARPSAAQQAVTLVSNIEQSDSDTLGVFTSDHAQAFTTGGNAGGYTLTSVEIAMSGFQMLKPVITVTVNADDDGSPGTNVGTLTNPDALANGNNEFAHATGLELDANTTYFIVVDAGNSASTGHIVTTDSDYEDRDGSADWSIADSSKHRTASSTGNWGDSSQSRKIRINGNERAPPTISIAANGATVTEGASAAFTLTASEAPDANLSVAVRVAASGEFGYGGNTGDQTVTIMAGTTTAAFSLTTSAYTSTGWRRRKGSYRRWRRW